MTLARSVRLLLALAVAAAVVLIAILAQGVHGTPSSASTPPPEPGHSIIPKIVKVAKHQVTNPDRNREKGGDNCNFYTTAIGEPGTGGTCTHNNWKTEKWCSDFVKWVYKAGGAQTNGLTPAAASGHAYGVRHHTWHKQHPRVGDLAVYASRHHVGIVTRISGSTLTIVSGNTYPPGRSSGPIDAVATHTASKDDIWGYASPVARPAS